MRSIYKKLYSFGPGGVNCPCCRPSGCHSKREALKVINRLVRRYYVRQIRAEVSDETR